MPSIATKPKEVLNILTVPNGEGCERLGNRRLSPVADERVNDICESVIDIVAALFNISGRELRAPGRSPISITRVRQLGMYVAHVVLGLSMADVGRGFGRDRTTVQYACHMIEDLRDDEDFDGVVALTERVTAAAFSRMGLLT